MHMVSMINSSVLMFMAFLVTMLMLSILRHIQIQLRSLGLSAVPCSQISSVDNLLTQHQPFPGCRRLLI